MASEFNIKSDIIEIGRRLWQRGFIASNDGNISSKLNKEEVLATPSGISKGFMKPEMIVKVSLDGKVLKVSEGYKPSSEIKMHLEVFRQRKDIHAVVHAHPPYATAFAVAGIPLDKCVLPEVVLTLGSIPIAPYATPSTEEVPQAVRDIIKQYDALLLANHGALTTGKDLYEAYYRMETLEHLAQITFLAVQLGNMNILPKQAVDKLLDVKRELAIPGTGPICQYRDKKQTEEDTESMISKITEEVIKKIKSS
ncbi:MAG: class II aldolase/adducin family protein [Spirochaetes bacterium]|nr:class II aldolase/adducin family protein [Spirochaetota bacterium]